MQRLLSYSTMRVAADAAVVGTCLRFASTQNVPAGHHNSDLSSAACNISLSRRRDITLRQDLKPLVDGKPTALGSLFKVQRLSHDFADNHSLSIMAGRVLSELSLTLGACITCTGWLAVLPERLTRAAQSVALSHCNLSCKLHGRSWYRTAAQPLQACRIGAP